MSSKKPLTASLSSLSVAAAVLALLIAQPSVAANTVSGTATPQVVPPAVGQPCTAKGAQEIDPYNSIETCLPGGNGLIWYLVGTDGIPSCAKDEVFNFNGSYLTCAKVQIQAPTCLSGQVLTFTGTALQCIYLATY